MKYLVVQDWENTHGNHAGMVHMCELLKEAHPDEYDYVVRGFPREFKVVKTRFIRRLWQLRIQFYRRYTYHYEYRRLCGSVFKRLKAGDEVFLLEYMVVHVPQDKLAMYIKRKYPYIKVYALSHLTPSFWKDPNIYVNMVRDWSRHVDRLLTLGSSLSSFFETCGVPREKISTGVHYVDNAYYCKRAVTEPSGRLKIIVMGAMQRNYGLVAEICRDTPFADWTICKGRANIEYLFDGLGNVTLRGFLAEEELRAEMDKADVSVNVMDDTVGSNVITTSLAMGLAMVCSDVGAIRDYCDESNTLFCANTADSFANAVKTLAGDMERVSRMKQSALDASKRLHIENIHKWFCSLGDV